MCSVKSHLISVYENDFLHTEREQNVKEEYLISPDDPLLLCLAMEPARPLILYQLILKTISLSHHGNEILGIRK